MSCFLSIIMILFILIGIWLLMALVFFRKEIKAIFDRDPAARNLIEVLFLYSGLHALIAHRIAHTFLKLRIPILPRAVSQLARSFTGIEIHPGSQIGDGLFIDHGMGVVIGETTIIGSQVTLFQGATLGGTGKETGKRHPTLGNNVVVGAGAKVLGNITIGDNSYIGANAVVIHDVPPNSTVVGVPGRLARQDGRKIEEKLDHVHVLDPVLNKIEALQKRIDELERT